MIGRTISQYEIREQLGEGGMGVVYRARDTMLQRDVALKVLPADKSEDPRSRRRFLREARAASALNHRHIVTIHTILREDDLDCIVMELVEGTSLDEHIPSGGLPVARAVAIALQIADAAGAAHAAGVIHRDLKPGNIMLGEGDQVKVLDFGLAKVASAAETMAPSATAPLTQLGTVLGTLDYMSPEQALGQPADARSDIFSLGAILYEMLSGRQPFQANSTAALLHAVAYSDPEDLAERRPGLPPAVIEVVGRALAKKPEERFQSMPELAAALAAIAEAEGGGRSVAGSRAGAFGTSRATAASVRRLVRRRPLVWAAVAAALVGVVAVASLPATRGALKSALSSSAGVDPVEGAGEGPEGELEALDASELQRRGTALLERYDREGAVDEAIATFQRAIAKRPDHAAAYAGLSRAYWRKYRDRKDPSWLDLAVNNARHAKDLDPHLTMARVSLGLALAARGATSEAIAEFEHTLRLDPSNPDLHRGLGDVYLTLGDLDRAASSYEEAVRLRPDDWQIQSAIGGLRFQTARYEEAEVHFRRSAELAEDNYLAHRNLGAVLHMQGRYGEAARELQRSLEIKPNSTVYSNLGTLYFYQGLYQEALSAFQRAVESGANHHVIWGNLGDAYARIPGNEARAREAYRRALQILDGELSDSPDDADLRSRRAVYLASSGERAEALAEITVLEGRVQRSANTLFRLALASEKAGDRARALGLLAGALEAGYSLEEVRKDPNFAELREDVRYHRLMLELDES